ncbi:hypothetical protein D6853_00615 [Butyrivibrio sp. X503]|uniref:CAP domain-containing protein n=1 Tax=Butyrivibrio sp. X503 TaxID=2364878 RepID=UPI000EA9FA57|nr:CAP domain-containing protein [Butyrivibrio sp. X503]RKM58072.1 hypothetical protein D6853_00615 [Butyrivibrio sp. X503]
MKKTLRIILALFIITCSVFAFEGSAYARSSNPPDLYDIIMLQKINSFREENGLSALELNDDLFDVADVRLYELPVNFDHTRPNGESYKTVYNELGLNNKYERGSENIAKILDDWDFQNDSGDEYVEYIFEAYVNSDSHRENMLKPYWKYYGGGFLTNYNGNCYQIQVFAK